MNDARPTDRSLPQLPERLRGARVLLVDDQELNLRLLRAVLGAAGLRDMILTTDPRAVRQLVVDRRPDLIVIDLHMPGLDGFGVMEELRPILDVGGYLPILVLTGDDSDEARRRALASGARDFLTKPIDATEVVLRARNLLETRMLYLELEARNAHLEERVVERTKEVRAAQLETLDRLARTAEFRDDLTGQHVVRVGRSAAILARAMGMEDPAVRLLRLAAPLHDLGKIGIPDAILLAPRRLEPDEFEEMKAHTLIGSRILVGSSSSLLQLAERIAMTHHERWDGLGYHGLVGEDIPLAARIVGVADVFDALTHARPYKEAWSLERSLHEIQVNAGRHFDPGVVSALDSVDPATLVDPAEPVDGADSWAERLRVGALGAASAALDAEAPGLQA